MNELIQNQMAHYSAKAEFELLNQKLTAVVETAGGELRFLIVPTRLVSDEAFNAAEIVDALNGFVEGIAGGAFLDLEAVKTAIAEVLDASNYKLTLNQVFFYIVKKDGEASIEYALELKIVNETVNETANEIASDAPGFKFFKVESLTFSLWNTQREKILETMDIWDIEKAVS